MIRLFWLLLCCMAPVRAEEIRLANGEWAPYLSESLPHYGFASHVVSAAFERAGIVARYEFYPWARAQTMVEKGTIAGSVVWSFTAEREAFAYFSDPVVTDEEVLFHRKDRPLAWKSFADLRGLNMATPLGSKLGVWDAPIRDGTLVNISILNIETGMKMLLAGRIDFFPLARTVGYQTLRSHFKPEERERITHAAKVAERIDYRLMLSRQIKGNAQRLERFNEGLRQLRRSGDYAKMEADLQAGKYD